MWAWVGLGWVGLGCRSEHKAAPPSSDRQQKGAPRRNRTRCHSAQPLCSHAADGKADAKTLFLTDRRIVSTHIRQMMKPAALVMEAMAKVAAEHSSCSTPWP